MNRNTLKAQPDYFCISCSGRSAVTDNTVQNEEKPKSVSTGDTIWREKAPMNDLSRAFDEVAAEYQLHLPDKDVLRKKMQEFVNLPASTEE